MKINKDSTEIEESVWDYKMSDVVIVAILGVIGTLIGSVIGLLCGTITESKRAENERRLHSQRVRFDYEFNLYQILAEKHLTMVYDIGTAVVISRGGNTLISIRIKTLFLLLHSILARLIFRTREVLLLFPKTYLRHIKNWENCHSKQYLYLIFIANLKNSMYRQ